MTLNPLGPGDITVMPPPCLTHQRAYDIYHPAFLRVIEYVTNSRIPGDILEFGTYHGYTARMFAELMRSHNSEKHLHLYDSWEGFPEMAGNDAQCPEVAVHGTWKKGDLLPIVQNAEQVIHQALNLILPAHVHVYKGFYEKTLPEKLPKQASVVHIDCDLYESTHFVLSKLLNSGVLQQGTVILFDDFNNNNASYRFGERRALKELFDPYIMGVTKANGGNFRTRIEPWFTYGSSGYAFIIQKD